MDLELSTPALLFPAISLLLLAYTNRFLVVAGLIRDLSRRVGESDQPSVPGQIANLRHRVELIRRMQALGVGSLLGCVSAMLLLFVELVLAAKLTFGVSLVLLVASLAVCYQEIRISVGALDLALADLECREEAMRDATRQR